MSRQSEDQYCFMDHWILELVTKLIFASHMLILTAPENGNTDFSTGSLTLQGQPCITTVIFMNMVQ